MDFEARRFGRGPRELGGSADLISQFKLWRHYESFCKKSIPVSISETRYLDNVVGDTEIRRGQGMELDQLFQNGSSSGKMSTPICRFDLDLLGDAFRINETSTIKLPQAEKGIPTGEVKLKSELKQKKKEKRKRVESKDEQREKDDDPKCKLRDVNKISKEDNNSGFELLKGPPTKKKKVFNGPTSNNQRSLVREKSKQRECWASMR